ncbi:competence/damage-inducible protein A [Lewinella sp. IMCC34183]|uniref:competence/damage-inducible protein A n=1 Tax=Lewinella sp. IMCC34183 TaxID=2248762 RepID=UPI000E26D4AE|nr:competence/damage-inducible protein A [Lewinella sp. IMCC34183]
MRATILTIGDEILIGQITDTNATYMAAALSEEGIEVVEHLSVSDSRIGIMGGLDRALQQSDIVLMSGGLGPTRDDITKQVLADYFGAELRLHNPTWKRLQQIYARHGRQATEAHRQQCRLPTGAKVMTNEHGTAPGLWMEKEDQVVVSMPGVPHEMMYLMDKEVIRRIRNQHYDADLLRSVTLLTAGAGESTIAEALEKVEDALPENMSLAYLPNLGTVRLRLSARGQDEALLQSQLDEYRTHIEGALGDLVYGYGTDDLALVVAQHLRDRGQTLVTAESCTGGMLGEMITSHSGASAHYLGGVVAYSNALKVSLLGVPTETIEAHGAVSEETVTAMAEGARERLGADYALATSGVAGPTGGTPDKPVGTVWIALATPTGTRTKLLRSGKDRSRNITYSSLQALNLLRLELGPAKRPTATAPPVVEETPAPKPKRKPRAKKADPAPKATPVATEDEKDLPEAAAPATSKSTARGRKKPAAKTAEEEPATKAKPAARGRRKPAAKTVEEEPATKAKPAARGRKKTATKTAEEEEPATKAKPAARGRKKPAAKKTEEEPATKPAKPARRGRRSVAAQSDPDPETDARAETEEQREDPPAAKPKRRPIRKK